MSKSETKAREENAALRRENRELRERIQLLEVRNSTLQLELNRVMQSSEIQHDGQLHA